MDSIGTTAVVRPHRMHAVYQCGLLLQLSVVTWFVCLSVGHNHALPRCRPFVRMWTRVGPRNNVGAGIPRGRDNFFRTGEHFPAHCEVHVGLYGISGVSQSYPVRGSTDAAYRCQYCSNLL